MTIGAALHGYYARSGAKSQLQKDAEHARCEQIIDELYRRMQAPEARETVLASITTYNGEPAQGIDYRPIVSDDLDERFNLRQILDLDPQKHALVVPSLTNFLSGHLDENSTASKFLKVMFPVIVADVAVKLFRDFPPRTHPTDLIFALRKMVFNHQSTIRKSFTNRGF